MSKICQITGKKAQIGNHVSHSKHRTKRSFDVNLFRLRMINKVGLDAALKQAVAKGFCEWKDIKVIGD